MSCVSRAGTGQLHSRNQHTGQSVRCVSRAGTGQLH